MEKTIDEFVSFFKTLPFIEMQRVHELLYREIQQCDEVEQQRRRWQSSFDRFEEKAAKWPKESYDYCYQVKCESIYPLVYKDRHCKPYYSIYDKDGNPIF